MTTGKIVLVTVLAGAISIAFAIFGQRWLGEEQGLVLPLNRDDTSDRIEQLPEFRLPDIAGRDMVSSSWAGKVLVLNFWATWCPPCLRELPLFDEIQQEHPDGRLQVVGIAIDSREDVERFLTDNPVGFPVLIGDTEAIEMSRRLGNRMQGLPYTVIFDHLGKRVYGQIGEMTRASLSEHLDPLLSHPDGAQTTGN